MRQRSFKRWICPAVTVALMIAFAAPVLADGESTARSILLPGSGQAQEGHYGKAAIFAGAAVVTGVGWFLSQVHYNQASMRYNDLRDIYLSYGTQLQAGNVVPYSSITSTYDDMQSAWDTAESRQTWRNVFLVSFLAVYTVNLIDILMSDPDTGEKAPDESAAGALQFQMSGEDVRVFKTFSF
jgi:hypothetical protein